MSKGRPNIRDWRDRHVQTYLDKQVYPHLQRLLDKAQAKLTRHKLAFFDGMGAHGFTIDGDTDNHLDDAVTFDDRKRRTRMYRQRFPELVEFFDIVLEVSEILNCDIGDMEPTDNAG